MNKLIQYAVMVAVGVLVFASLLVPLTNEATATTTTFNNTGIYYMENPSEPISVIYEGGTDWTIDGAPLEYTVYGATNIIVTEDIFIRNVGQVRGSVYAGWKNAELTIGNGSITGTATLSNDTTAAVNYTYEYVYVATSEKSDNIMTLPDSRPYITSDSVLIGKGLTTIKDSDGNNNTGTFYVEVNNLTPTVTTLTPNVSITNVQLNTNEVAGYVGLYQFTSVTFTAVWGEYSTNCTYNILIAPAEVTAEKAIHADDSTRAIIGVIPLIVIVGLIAGIVGVVAIRRNA